jgi:hypothetical protein
VEDEVGVVPAGVPDVGPVHPNSAPEVDEDPLKVTVAVVQVIVCPDPALTLGTAVLVVTVTLAVLVHPFAGLVTVTVYVPFAETLVEEAFGVVPAGVPLVGPVHANVAPPVEDDADTVTVGEAQVITWFAPAVTLGVAVFVVTETVEVFVQPFVGFVTVKVYVPDALTTVEDADGVVPAGVPLVGPVHANVTPLVVELPVNVAVVFVQLMVWLLPALTFGVVVLVVTLTVAVLVHPLVGLVTVSV